MIKSVKKLS